MALTITSHRPVRRLATLLVAVLASLALISTAAQARSFQISWQPNAESFWSHNDSTINAIFHNGQCTQWAAERRPDILRRGTEAIIAAEIAADRPEDMGDWNAAAWPANARQAGIPTGSVPRDRALVVFQPGVLGAGSSGHIAYVRHVDADGSFQISEMHAPVLYRVTERRLPAADARLAGVSFIY